MQDWKEGFILGLILIPIKFISRLPYDILRHIIQIGKLLESKGNVVPRVGTRNTQHSANQFVHASHVILRGDKNGYWICPEFIPERLRIYSLPRYLTEEHSQLTSSS